MPRRSDAGPLVMPRVDLIIDQCIVESSFCIFYWLSITYMQRCLDVVFGFSWGLCGSGTLLRSEALTTWPVARAILTPYEITSVALDRSWLSDLPHGHQLKPVLKLDARATYPKIPLWQDVQDMSGWLSPPSSSALPIFLKVHDFPKTQMRYPYIKTGDKSEKNESSVLHSLSILWSSSATLWTTCRVANDYPCPEQQGPNCPLFLWHILEKMTDAIFRL